MVRKLGGPDDTFVAYRTGHYKLHYYETPTNLKFVMVTDTKTNALRVVLHQIWVNLWVEYGRFPLTLWENNEEYPVYMLIKLTTTVVKNPSRLWSILVA